MTQARSSNLLEASELLRSMAEFSPDSWENRWLASGSGWAARRKPRWRQDSRAPCLPARQALCQQGEQEEQGQQAAESAPWIGCQLHAQDDTAGQH